MHLQKKSLRIFCTGSQSIDGHFKIEKLKQQKIQFRFPKLSKRQNVWLKQ